MFSVTTDNFEYEPASPGLGTSPTYLVTPRNDEGMCIELHYTSMGAPKTDQLGQRIITGAWHVSEYDKTDERMDDYWFVNFADADAHAFGLWT